jgi:hypothetical protein
MRKAARALGAPGAADRIARRIEALAGLPAADVFSHTRGVTDAGANEALRD